MSLYSTKPEVVNENEDYHPETRRKLNVYDQAGLVYKIQYDGYLNSLNAFHKRRNTEMYDYSQMVTHMARLRDKDNPKVEKIIWRVQEKLTEKKVGVQTRKPREFVVHVWKGIDEVILTEPVVSDSTGELLERSIAQDGHLNKFVTNYSPEKVNELLANQDTNRYKPSLLIAYLNQTYPTRWQNPAYTISYLDDFIKKSFDELLLMGQTGEDTLEGAMSKTLKLLENKNDSKFGQISKRELQERVEEIQKKQTIKK